MYGNLKYPKSLETLSIHYGDVVENKAYEKILHSFEYGAIRLFTYFSTVRLFSGKNEKAGPIKKIITDSFHNAKAVVNKVEDIKTLKLNENELNKAINKELEKDIEF